MNIITTSKANLQVLLGSTLIIFSLLAHADYKNALTALNNSDGTAMLLAVKAAEDQGDDKDAHLFIMQLRYQLFKQNFLSTSERDNKNLYTLTTLLSKKQEKELLSLLERSVNQPFSNSSYEEYLESQLAVIFIKRALKQQGFEHNQLLLCHNLKKIASEARGKIKQRTLIEYISSLSLEVCKENSKKTQLDLLKLAAELGYPYAQSDLSLLYLGEKAIEKYQTNIYVSSLRGLVKPDATKSEYWLKQSIINARYPDIPSSYCEYAKKYHYGSLNIPIDLKQAYLLYMWQHLSTIGYNSCASQGLINMFKDGSLERVAPQYYLSWRAENTRTKNNIKPPIEGVNNLAIPILSKHKDSPKLVFSYLNSLFVYANGIVVIKNGVTIDKWTLPQSKIKKLASKLEGLKLMEQPVYLGTLWDERRPHYQISFTFNGQSKTIYTNYYGLLNQSLKAVNDVMPNPYLKCNNEDRNNSCKLSIYEER